MTDLLWEGLREGCGTCTFRFRRSAWTTVKGVEIVTYECRRFPPTVIQQIERDVVGNPSYEIGQYHPRQNETDWCGEYKRKASEARVSD